MFENLKGKNIILASKSPRRREMLKELGVDFEIISIDGVEEKYPENLETKKIAEFLSNLKADAYLSVLNNNDLIITADTIVVCDNKVLGKPNDYDCAINMLMSLSGKTHEVITGVTILTAEKRTSFSVSTDVEFANITREEAEYYVDKYSPFDKAGAYGIQEWIGYVAVKSINGSFYNVMGLPLHRLYQELKSF